MSGRVPMENGAMLVPIPGPHYYGTSNAGEIEALKTALKRQGRRSNRSPLGGLSLNSRPRLCLTPSFALAEHQARLAGSRTAEPHVFTFNNLARAYNIFVDGADVGWSAFACVGGAIGGDNTQPNANHEFCANFLRSEEFAWRDLLSYYLSLAPRANPSQEIRFFSRVAQSALSGRKPNLAPGGRVWDKVGLGLAPLLSDRVIFHLLRAGANISVTANVFPSSYVVLDVAPQLLSVGSQP